MKKNQSSKLKAQKKSGDVDSIDAAKMAFTAAKEVAGEGAGFQQMVGAERSAGVVRPVKVPVTWLVVKRALPVNTRIVEAHPFGKPQQVKVVRVRDNRNFVRGMLLEARWVQGNTFELVGPLPRWHGKWGYPQRVEPVLVAPGAKETKTK